MPKLTKKTINALKPRDKEYVVWDSEIRGFGARVRPSGKISYVFKYRVGGGRTGTPRKPTIGVHGTITPAMARKIASDWAGEVAQGGDPGGQRKEGRKAPTVNALCERYLSEYAEVHKKPSSVKEDRRLIEKRIKPAMGKKKAAAVMRADVRRLHASLNSKPFEANRTLALLSKIMNEAEGWGLRPQHSNPCVHVKRYTEAARRRRLSADELKRLGKSLDQAEREETEPRGVIAAIRLLAFTGCRLGEVLSARWKNVDFAQGMLKLEDAKAGPRDVALGAPALALLRSLDRNGEWVISGKATDAPLTGWALQSTWRRLCGKAEVTNARLHDLRHLYGTYAGGLGLNAFMIRDLLGHKTLAMTGLYVQRDTDPLRAAADAVSGRIAAAMKGEQAEVVEFSKRQR